MSSFRLWLKNIGLVVLSVSLLFMLLEGIVFRYFLPASDLPMLAENDGGLLRYESSQSGIYRIKDEIEARFNINQQGWNSPSNYSRNREEGRKRIIVIGDSYIEALQVDATSSVAELLEQELTDQHARVYRVAMSGAPLSHYVYMLREEAVQYKPDLVIINLVHNDFDESFGLAEGTYTESFATYGVDNDGSLKLVDPKPFHKNLAWYLKQSATFRYLYVRMKIFPRVLVKTVMSWITEPTGQTAKTSPLPPDVFREERTEQLLRTALKTIRHLQDKYNFELLVLMDADRSATTRAIDSGDVIPEDGLRFNRLVSRIGADVGVTVLDLQPLIEEDYLRHRQSFDFKNDYHWNQYMHRLVAVEVAQKVRECDLLINPMPGRC